MTTPTELRIEGPHGGAGLPVGADQVERVLLVCPTSVGSGRAAPLRDEPVAPDRPWRPDCDLGSVSATASLATEVEKACPGVGFTFRRAWSARRRVGGRHPDDRVGIVTLEPGPTPKYQPVTPAAAASTRMTRKIASRVRRPLRHRASAEVESETSVARGPRGVMIAVSHPTRSAWCGRAKATVSPVAAPRSCCGHQKRVRCDEVAPGGERGAQLDSVS